MLVAFGADADELGALSCAALWEPGAPGPVVANVMVFVVEPVGAPTGEAELEAIAETLGSSADSDIGPRDVDQVSLPVGPAARVRFLREADGDGAPSVVFDQTSSGFPYPNLRW